MAALVQKIVLEVDGVGKVNAQLKITQAELDKLGAAGGRADEGIKKAERSSLTLGQSMSKASEVLGKVTFAASAAGAILGGALTGAVGGLVTALGHLAETLGISAARAKALAAEGRALTDEQVRQATGVTNLAAAYEVYARTLGTTASKLTLVQEMEAKRRLVNGQLQTQESVRADLAPAIERRDTSQRALDAARARRQRMGIAEPGYAERVLMGNAARDQAEVDRLERMEAGVLGVGPWQTRAKDAVAAVKGYLILQAAEVTNFVGKVETEIERHRLLRAGMAAGGGGAAPKFTDSLYGVYGRQIGRFGSDLYDFASGQARVQDGMNARAASFGAGYMAEQEARDARDAARMQMQAQERRAIAANGLSGRAGGAFGGLVEEAQGAAGLFASATSQISGSFGQMWTNIILSGANGTKGFKRYIGDMLAGVSAQAFGYATLLGGMAIAAGLTGPILGWSAGNFAAAAAVMAGTGAALALTAKGLGASASGGFGGKGGGGGGGGGSKLEGGRLAGERNFGGGGVTNVTVVVGISGRQVHDAAVKVAGERASSRGQPRLLVAT